MERLPEVSASRTKSGKGKTGKKSVLDNLKPDEAAIVLRRLLAATNPDLGREAEQIARSLLHEATFESVADSVEDAVQATDIDDLNSRAGGHSWGYVEPSEAAVEILEETVEPYVDDMLRQIELGLQSEALEICKGIVLGLYRIEQGKGGELMDWAPDFPAESAGNAVETWRDKSGRRTKPRLSFSRDFLDRFVPKWREMIERILSRK